MKFARCIGCGSTIARPQHVARAWSKVKRADIGFAICNDCRRSEARCIRAHREARIRIDAFEASGNASFLLSPCIDITPQAQVEGSAEL